MSQEDTTMRYERFERVDCDHKADTVGLWPGVAGVYMEGHADIYCPECSRDMLGSDLYDRVKEGNPGYDHSKSDTLGNVAAVLSSEESDCPGDYCGHCGIQLDVRVLHYDGVCQPDVCSETHS